MAQHHVIIGGGPAATNAVETIRIFDSEAEITLVCDEPAHSRMALPYWLAGSIAAEQTHTGDAAHFKKLGVDTRFGLRVASIDAGGNSVALSDGSVLSYDNLLIATGSSPLAPPIPGTDLPGVQPLWSLAHTQQLLDGTSDNKKPRVVLVGAGFIGFIVLNAMFKRGWDLTVVERVSQVLPRMLDGESAGFVQNWLSSKNVAVHAGTEVKSISAGADGEKLVHLENGEQIAADIVIIATGIKANLGLIDGAGIDSDAGILVNDQMQSSVPNIYAAGDVAQGPVLFSDQRSIHAIQPTAVDHGRVAGANMAGQDVHYSGSLLMNVVDVCGLQAVSYGAWDDTTAEVTTISNPINSIYRKLLWHDDRLVGAIFTGQADDLGMLTDIGMVKGILQTQTKLGPWKRYLIENAFDVRRAFIGAGVAQKLVQTTLLGSATKDRKYHFAGAEPKTTMGASHKQFVGTKPK
jgi:NAD(P)H-nitrite reductase large subunit